MCSLHETRGRRSRRNGELSGSEGGCCLEQGEGRQQADRRQARHSVDRRQRGEIWCSAEGGETIWGCEGEGRKSGGIRCVRMRRRGTRLRCETFFMLFRSVSHLSDVLLSQRCLPFGFLISWVCINISKQAQTGPAVSQRNEGGRAFGERQAGGMRGGRRRGALSSPPLAAAKRENENDSNGAPSKVMRGPDWRTKR